jgi:flagellar hook-length control protein FliK
MKDAGEAGRYERSDSKGSTTTPATAEMQTPRLPRTDTAQLVRMATQQAGARTQLQPVMAMTDARPESGTQAFLDAARGATAKRSARTAGAEKPLSDPEFVDRAHEIMRQIRLNMAPGATNITLDLEPAELGRLWIRMSMRGGRLAATVRAERQETLEALEPKLAELRALFEERGIAVDTIELELGFQKKTSDSPSESFEGHLREPNTPPLRVQTAEPPEPIRASEQLNADGIDTYA